MELVLTGINHKSAPVGIREKIAFGTDDLLKALSQIRQFPEIRESAILSTCNRTEIYAITGSEKLIPEYLSQFHQVSMNQFANHLYQKHDMEAARHLFQVAGGLDSLVVGENQILSQVKQVLKFAQEAKSLGTVLYRLFQTAILAGKRIRTETALSENPGSIGEAAVDLAQQIFGDLQGKRILVLGAGEMGQVVMQALGKAGVSRPQLCSRTYQNALALAEKLNGTAHPYEKLESLLSETEIVIAATGSPVPVLSRNQLEKTMRERRYAPLFIIDIAVPRDVEESAGSLENLYLYNIDDLQGIVNKANQAREKEIVKASRIVDEELARFEQWKDSLSVIPTIRALNDRMDEIKKNEVERILSKYPHLSEQERAALENLAHALTNKILHEPLVQLKNYGNHPLGTDYLEVARDLFGLNHE